MKGKGLELMTFRIKTILLILLILSKITVSPGWSVEVGERLPDFSIQTFDGATVSPSTLAGRPLMVIFWNTWCPNCMRELPEVNRLAGKFAPRGLAVLAANTAVNDSEKKARAYWLKQGFVFPSGFDHDFEIGDAFGVRGVPTIFLIDSKGIVLYKQALVPENMEERLEQLLRSF